MHGRTLTVAKEIIRICRDRNLLKEYLGEREREVEEIMSILFDQEYIWDLERNSIRAEALAEGMNLGIAQGRNEGIWENKTQTVLKMFRRNMSLEDIADISGCSVGEVNEILKNAANPSPADVLRYVDLIAKML